MSVLEELQRLRQERKTFVDGVLKLNQDNNRLRAENEALRLGNVALSRRCERQAEEIKNLRGGVAAWHTPLLAVIEDESIDTAEALKRRLRLANAVTATDLQSTIDSLLSLKRIFTNVTQP